MPNDLLRSVYENFCESLKKSQKDYEIKDCWFDNEKSLIYITYEYKDRIYYVSFLVFSSTEIFLKSFKVR